MAFRFTRPNGAEQRLEKSGRDLHLFMTFRFTRPNVAEQRLEKSGRDLHLFMTFRFTRPRARSALSYSGHLEWTQSHCSGRSVIQPSMISLTSAIVSATSLASSPDDAGSTGG